MVYFVGAGPGAADLITVRGMNFLKEAEVIIYAGSLVNPILLDYKKPSCKVYNSATMTLEEVIEVMKKINAEGAKTIVRLHTGDPCIYGTHREQMDELNKLNIPYDVVPGVSSFIGAAAALKAELTLPDVSQSVILTRMEGRTPVPPKEDIGLLASHGATMVVFLTSTMLDELSKKLIEGGYEAGEKAAIVYKATWPDQKIVYTTVEEIGNAAKANGINKMALIFVGGFLGNSYDKSKLYDPTFTHEFREARK